MSIVTKRLLLAAAVLCYPFLTYTNESEAKNERDSHALSTAYTEPQDKVQNSPDASDQTSDNKRY